MKLYIKSNSNSNSGYLYIFKHGIGPGTVPKDVAFLKEKDLPNGYTAVWLDRFLTDRELKAYDIPSETEINYYLDRIGYCQKNGDVVPCDDIEACGDIEASRTIDRWDHNTEKYEPVEIPDDWNVKMYSDNMDEIINCPNCGKEFPYGEGYTSRRYHNKYGMGYMECEDCYYEQLNDEFGNKDIEACDEVMASVDMSFSKKAKQLAQSAWDKGMTIPRAKKYIFDIMTKDGYSTDFETVPDTINKIVIQVYDEQGDPNDPSTWVDACDKVIASDICYRDRDNDDRVVALDAGMSDEDVEKMLADHPSYYRSTLDSFDACDEVTASNHRYSAGRIEDDGSEDFYYDTGFDSWDEACDWGINHECTHIYDREQDAFLPIESCDTRYFANMVSASDNSNYFKYKVCGYYDADKRGLAASEDVDDTQLVNAWANEYANKGYYITIEDRESGSIMEFSPDEWFEYWYMA